ncbi:MAG: hypothetical protein AAB495_04495 [Patescibacteria group bacterium]
MVRVIAVPKMSVSPHEPLLVGSRVSITIDLGVMFGNLRLLTESMEVWLICSDHFSVEKGKEVLRLSAEEIRAGHRKLHFPVTVQAVEKTEPPTIQALFSYNGRPCGKIERTFRLAAAR